MDTNIGLDFNPYSAELHADPYATYRRLRDEAPVYRSDRFGFWALSRYTDVFDAICDTETFSSAGRINLDDLSAPERGEIAGLPLIIEMDPPRHTELRDVLKQAFTPRSVARMEPTVRDLARELLDEMPAHDECDYVAGFAGPLPIMVIGGMLDLPRSEWNQFKTWSDTLVRRTRDATDMSDAALMAAVELLGYFSEIIEYRRKHPGADLISTLIAAQGTAPHITDEELFGYCFLFLVGGHETTTTLLCNTMSVLEAHPDTRARVADDPGLVPSAIEETFRFDSPSLGMGRTLTRDVTLHGTSLRAGDRALLVYGAANRDERAFPDADRFDIDRGPTRHLGLGHGTHYCLGAALGRLQARVAVEEFLARYPEYEIDRASITRNVQVNIRSISRMRMRL